MARVSRASYEKRNRERAKHQKRMEKLERRMERRTRSREAHDALMEKGEGTTTGAQAREPFEPVQGAESVSSAPVSGTPVVPPPEASGTSTAGQAQQPPDGA